MLRQSKVRAMEESLYQLMLLLLFYWWKPEGNVGRSPWPDGSLGWSLIPHTKSCRFEPQSGNIPSLWVPSLVEMCMGSNRWMSVCLSLSLSQINKNTPQVRILKKCWLVRVHWLFTSDWSQRGRNFCIPTPSHCFTLDWPRRKTRKRSPTTCGRSHF